MKLLRALLQRFLQWLAKKPHPLTTKDVAELPDTLNARSVYVMGENEHIWSVAMLCPCGCGEILHMNALPDAKPRWKIERHSDRTVSLYPSIWRKVGCRSHFYVRRGFIQWCQEDDE